MAKTTYKAISENLTALGGPMGTERTWENWSRYFEDAKSAKAACERDYAKTKANPKEPLKWTRSGSGWSTQDLRFVMYHVQPITVERGGRR